MKQALPYLFLFLISVIALRALFASPFLPLIHDQVQAERVYELSRSLSFGQFPVRFVSDLGYGFGYPLFNYYAPFPYYLAGILFLLGMDLILATKLMIAFSFVFAGFSMYIFAKQFWGRTGAVLSALLYMIAPYHGVQLYVRGSIGELFTYALVPLICLGLSAFWQQKVYKTKVTLGLTALALLSFSHTVGFYMTILLISLYLCAGTLYLAGKKRGELSIWFKRNILFVIVSLALGAFFWLPALGELGYTQLSVASGNNVNYRDHFVTVGQLWNSPWGFAGSAPGVAKDGMSFMIGKISIVLALISIFAVRIHRKAIGVFTALAMLSIFLMLGVSTFVWEIIPFMRITQFPWRYLLFLNVSLCFIAGGTISIVKKFTLNRNSNIASLIIFFLVSVIGLFGLTLTDVAKTKYFEASGYYQYSSEKIKDPTHLRLSASRISDEYRPLGVRKAITLEAISNETVSCLALCLVKDLKLEPTNYQFLVSMEKTAPVYIDKVYFPGFVATVDGEKKEIIRGPDNMLGVSVDGGKHSVEFKLQNTPLRNIGNTISLLSLICIILYPFRSKIWNLRPKQKLLKI
ncbi:MAG: 6-pyruvoyl-tetrahydropterin synthase-related protein [bacterium]|nr:6-pyruvoyl-tetrahydropterin synthase-related protein [bacterium]